MVDEALLVEDTVTAVVQIQGKVKARLEVPPDDLRRRPGGRWRWPTRPCSTAIDGREVRKVIVRAPKLVNVVV